jgi:hypothetical protein
MDAASLDGLEEIAEQTRIRVNTRNNRGNFGWSIPPHLARASAAREVEKKETLPAEPKSAAPVIHIFSAFEATCYAELIAGIRQKLAALEIRYLDFDVLASFAPGLSGKVFGPSQAKRLGPEKLFDALRAAGLRIRVEEDPVQTAKMRQRIAENYLPRQSNQARPHNRNHARPSDVLINRVLGYLSNNAPGGLTLLNGAANEARSNWSRRAARSLWEKRRACGPVDFATYLDSAPDARPPG